MQSVIDGGTAVIECETRADRCAKTSVDESLCLVVCCPLRLGSARSFSYSLVVGQRGIVILHNNAMRDFVPLLYPQLYPTTHIPHPTNHSTTACHSSAHQLLAVHCPQHGFRATSAHIATTPFFLSILLSPHLSIVSVRQVSLSYSLLTAQVMGTQTCIGSSRHLLFTVAMSPRFSSRCWLLSDPLSFCFFLRCVSVSVSPLALSTRLASLHSAVAMAAYINNRRKFLILLFILLFIFACATYSMSAQAHH